MKKKKLLLIILIPVVSVALLGGAVFAAFQNAAGSRNVTVGGMKLEATDLQSEISATGTVQSAESKTVYSTLTYPIQSVSVEVGDKVNAGDVLCVIDSADLKTQIATQEATLESSNITTSYQLSASEKTYNEAKNNLENGMNAELLSAQNALKTAEMNLKEAQRKYQDSMSDNNSTTSTQLSSAKKELDTAQATYDTTVKTAKLQLDSAERAYNDVQNNPNSSDADVLAAQKAFDTARSTYDTSLKTAQISLDNAKAQYSKSTSTATTSNSDRIAAAQKEMNTAQINYNATKSQYETKLAKDTFSNVASVKAAESKLASLKQAYLSAKSTVKSLQVTGSASEIAAASDKMNKAKTAYDEQLPKVYDLILWDELRTLRKELTSTENTYENAKDAYEALLSEVNSGVTSYKSALDTAQLAYNNAVTALEAAELSANRQLQTYKSDLDKNIASAQANPNMIQLADLKTKLDKCTVTAPISGTVTSVTAKEGNSSAGALFVIEKTDTLKIKANIKEFDIAKVSENMKVLIESDATGDDVYEGYVSRVSPAGVKDTNNATQFEIEVTVNSADTRLLIGMSTRLNIVTEEKTGAIAVRYEALQTDDDGSEYVFVANDNGDGTYTAKKIPVTTGLETDFMVEVSGEGLTNGATIITDIGMVQDGSIVRLSE